MEGIRWGFDSFVSIFLPERSEELPPPTDMNTNPLRWRLHPIILIGALLRVLLRRTEEERLLKGGKSLPRLFSEFEFWNVSKFPFVATPWGVNICRVTA